MVTLGPPFRRSPVRLLEAPYQVSSAQGAARYAEEDTTVSGHVGELQGGVVNAVGEPVMRKRPLFAIVSAVLLAGYASLNAVQSRSHDPSRFTYTQIYCTPDTETHFQDVTVELAKMNFVPPAAPLYVGGNLPASRTFFGGADPHWGVHDLENRLNHPAPAAQFIILLKGVWSVTTTDGETRRFGPGDVVRAEDTSPCKGHITVNVTDTPGFMLFAR